MSPKGVPWSDRPRKKNRIRKGPVIDTPAWKTACDTCGYDHPATLVWHHIQPKDHSPKYHGQIGDRVLAIKEATKCRVLCHNCHHILHYNERIQLGG